MKPARLTASTSTPDRILTPAEIFLPGDASGSRLLREEKAGVPGSHNGFTGASAMAAYPTDALPHAKDREMILQGLAALTPNAALRIANLHGPIRIRVRHRQGLAPESLFTLHSLTGRRATDGSVEVERIAGFCHLRNALTNYWYDRVACIHDPATGEAIEDLAAWASTPPSAEPAPGSGAEPSSQDDAPGRSSRLGAEIDRAILHADMFGAGDIAQRLRQVRRAIV